MDIRQRLHLSGMDSHAPELAGNGGWGWRSRTSATPPCWTTPPPFRRFGRRWQASTISGSTPRLRSWLPVLWTRWCGR